MGSDPYIYALHDAKQNGRNQVVLHAAEESEDLEFF